MPEPTQDWLPLEEWEKAIDDLIQECCGITQIAWNCLRCGKELT